MVLSYTFNNYSFFGFNVQSEDISLSEKNEKVAIMYHNSKMTINYKWHICTKDIDKMFRMFRT